VSSPPRRATIFSRGDKLARWLGISCRGQHRDVVARLFRREGNDRRTATVVYVVYGDLLWFWRTRPTRGFFVFWRQVISRGPLCVWGARWLRTPNYLDTRRLRSSRRGVPDRQSVHFAPSRGWLRRFRRGPSCPPARHAVEVVDGGRWECSGLPRGQVFGELFSTPVPRTSTAFHFTDSAALAASAPANAPGGAPTSASSTSELSRFDLPKPKPAHTPVRSQFEGGFDDDLAPGRVPRVCVRTWQLRPDPPGASNRAPAAAGRGAPVFSRTNFTLGRYQAPTDVIFGLRFRALRRRPTAPKLRQPARAVSRGNSRSPPRCLGASGEEVRSAVTRRRVGISDRWRRSRTAAAALGL